MGLFTHGGGNWSGPERRRDRKAAARWDGIERRRARCPSQLEGLESRLLMHGHVDPSSLLDWNDMVNTNTDAISLTLLAQAQAGTKMPLSSVPQLASDPGAPATIYLDFVGAPAMTWFQSNVPATPAYDQDGDPTTFSSAELTSINQIWQIVSEEYSPFNINVTTVPLASLAHGQNMEMIIGGSSETWLGEAAGGVSYIGSFANSSLPNISFVFPAQLANGTPKYTGEAAAHEAGHEFSLFHQALWSGNTLVQDYNPGTSAFGPVMGDPYNDTRALWYDGASDVSSTTIQNDMAVIADAQNGFGYRDDNISHSLTLPTSLTAGSSLSASGIISTTSQVDYYQFTTGAGSISLSASQFDIAGSFDGMLSLKFSLYNSNDQLVASSGIGLTESLAPTLAAGTYIVAISSDGSYGDVGQYTFSGTVVQSPPTTPTALTAVAAGTSAVNLSWSDTVGDATGFYIERSTDDVHFTQIGSATSTTYQDTGLNSATTYYYRIRAYNSVGDSSYTSIASTTTQTALPADPTSLIASAISTSAISISWTDNSSNETSFFIERSPDNTNWTQIASVNADITAYTDTSLPSGSTYYYRARAHNSGGDSGYTNVSSATTPISIPGVPTGLLASVAGSTEIDLSWDDNSNQAGFYIERSPDNSNWTQIASTASTAYQDTGLDPSSTFYYRVRAYNVAGNSGYAGPASATTLVLAPSAPAALGATSTSTAEIDLSWINTASNATEIYIERSPDNSSWTQIASVSPAATTYADTGLNVGATYFYRLRAHNAGGDSPYCGTASAVAYPLIPPPMAAQGAAASPTTFDQITLNWTPGPGDTGFLIQRSPDRSNWNTIAQLPQSVTSYTDTAAESASHYFYRVIAFNTVGNAPASNLASATTPGFSVILDNSNADDAAATGPWSRATAIAGYFGSDFLQDNNLHKGQSIVRFSPTLPEDGVYQVALRWTSAPNRADNVPVTINYDGGSVTVKINQRQNGGQWVVLGAFNFASGSTGSIIISNANTDGIVVADAVRFVKISGPTAGAVRISPNVTIDLAPLPNDTTDADALTLAAGDETMT